MTGENGLAQAVIFLSNILESWSSKFNTYAHAGGKISETEWLIFYSQLDEWIDALNKSLTYVGKATKDNHDDISDEKKKSKSITV